MARVTSCLVILLGICNWYWYYSSKNLEEEISRLKAEGRECRTEKYTRKKNYVSITET
jgi:hypothetical protein